LNYGFVGLRSQGCAQNKQIQGLGLKVIDDLAKILIIKYTLQSSEEGTVFTFVMGKNIVCEEVL
jgi:hypothetical protein